MDKWEYEITIINDFNNKELEAKLYFKGCDGWELVQILNNMMIMKRKKIK